MSTPLAPPISPDVYDDTFPWQMQIIHDFAHGHATDTAMAERIIRPWIDADARTLRHQEAPTARPPTTRVARRAGR